MSRVTPYPRNIWYCAATSAELGDQPLGRTLLGNPIVLYRREDGTAVALDDACVHRRAPLHKGQVEGDNIRCPYHGLLFNDAGQCIWMPGKEQPPRAARVSSYPIVERHGWLWIWPGAPDRMDPDAIIDCPPCTSPDWAAVSGMMTMDADAMLLVDNLMDLSHVAFVHRETIGSEEDKDPELDWERTDNRVSGTRMARNLSPAPVYESMGLTGRTDQVKVMTFLPATNVIVDIKIAAASPGAFDMEGAAHQIIYNFMTPAEPGRCHYFFAATRNFRIDDEELTATISRNNIPLLIEDKAIIESVQGMMDAVPESPMVSFAGDTGSVLSRRIVEHMLREEA